MVCVYFNLRFYPAGRGYGYAGANRFRNRRGCFLYGKLRVADFVWSAGEDKEDEILEMLAKRPAEAEE